MLNGRFLTGHFFPFYLLILLDSMENLFIHDEVEMESLGNSLAEVCPVPCRIYLQGNLGAGKTTLVRGLLRGMDYAGPVKSPTYALIEPYAFESCSVNHLDLYRLSDPEELEYIGCRDLLEDDSILLVEWPEKGAGVLPEPDVSINIEYAPGGRLVRLQAHTKQGDKLLVSLKLEALGA